MDHTYIEQCDLVEQYLAGKLSAEEVGRFEEHFIDCPQCIDQLSTTRNIKQGLRLLTIQQISQADNYSPRLPRQFFQRRTFWPSATLAACCLLVAAIACLVFLANHSSRSRLEADQAKSDASDWQRRYEEQQQSTLSSEQQRQELEQGLRGQVRQLDAELESEHKQRYDKRNEAGDTMQPSINLPIFIFSSVRGNARNPSSGINEISLPRLPVNFVVSVPLEGGAKYMTYRLRILSGQRLFWVKTGAKPDRDNALTMGFSSSFFRPGDYLLLVEGISGGPQPATVDQYPFRVTKH